VSVKVERIDSANLKVEASISKSEIEKNIDKLAKEAAKTVKVDGFRKGKVPPAVVKKMYGDKLKQDAEAEALREVLNKAYKEAGIEVNDVLGNPTFEKFDDSKEDIELELLISTKPNIELGDYSDIIPKFEKPEVSEDEIKEELENIAQNFAKPKSIKEDRELKEGDIAVFDFKGFIDGEAFEGGSATNYELKIGSKQFIEGFEDQMIGMKKGEEKTIKVAFPQDYQAKNLQGKEAEFKIKLHDIKELDKPAIDDELAKKALSKEDATLKELQEYAKNILYNHKIRKLYEEELKDKILENIIKKYNFDLPKNIVEQEIDNLANQKAQTLKKEELEEVKKNPEKLKELRESVREDAQNSVKATFVVDALAKAENVEVSDGEVSQALYYEALMSGQDPQKLIEHYQANNLIPIIKMGMIEDKLFTKLLKLDEKEESTKKENK